MTDILSRIAAQSYKRVEERKRQKSLIEISKEAEESGRDNRGFSFERALKTKDIAFVCEVKKASPSKGILDEEFPYLKIAREYEKAGAAAISVLTEPDWFLGKDEYLKEIRKAVKVPVLRKDFTVDCYQIYEAKLMGADAILLICAILDQKRLKEYIKIAHGLGLSVLAEAHTEEEVHAALDSDARMIGVNNRNLKTFEVDINQSMKLRNLVPEHILFLSESGIRTSEDVQRLRECKVNGILIGETLMRSNDKKEEILRLRGERK